MKTWKQLITIFFLLISINVVAKPQPIDKIIAIVNEDIILKSELDKILNSIKNNLVINKNIEILKNIKILNKKILEQLIVNKILFQTIQKDGIYVTKQEIDNIINNIALRNNLNIQDFQKNLVNHGVNIEQYKNKIYQELIIQKICNKEIAEQIIIFPQEINSFVKRLNLKLSPNSSINLSHILIKIPQNLKEQEKKLTIVKINKIIKFLRKNRKNYSQFKKISNYLNQQNINFKQIGWKTLKKLSKKSMKYVQNAKKGEIIGPIRSKFGFHILKVNDIKYCKPSYFETKVKIRYILIKTSPMVNKEQSYEKINKIYKKIINKKLSFSNAAYKYSEDQNTKLQYGNLGWGTIKSYSPNLQHILIHLQKGKFYKPIYSDIGWHIFYLEDIKKIDKIKILQKNYAYHILFNKKIKEALRNWIQKQKESSYIRTLIDE